MNPSHRTIKHWPSEERPRERLIASGPASLSDAQLLAVLLRTGRERASAVDLALDLLKRFGGLKGLSRLSIAELCAVSGIGPAKAAQLQAALELGRRALGTPLKKGIKIRGSLDVYRHYLPLLRDQKREVFLALLLDSKHRVLKELIVSTGSVNLSIVHPREVFNPAVRESAAAVIVLHNHPSGDPAPSREDRELTSRLVKAGEIMGIALLDHLIIGDGQYVSFAEQGFLAQPKVRSGA
jgi:DNA repair protein RadC